MCRLFGIIANREVDIEFSFHRADKPFKSFSEDNPDGWGIGYYSKEGEPRVFKQGLGEEWEEVKLGELIRIDTDLNISREIL